MKKLILVLAALIGFAGCTAATQSAPTRLLDNKLGMPIGYDTTPMDVESLKQTMNQFLVGYTRRDPAALKDSLTSDFVWTVHIAPEDYRGTAYHGVSGLIDVLVQRDKDWDKVIYSNVQVYGVGDHVFQTFRVQGIDAKSGPFDTNGIDIYVIRDGKVASKDSYWKIR